MADKRKTHDPVQPHRPAPIEQSLAGAPDAPPWLRRSPISDDGGEYRLLPDTVIAGYQPEEYDLEIGQVVLNEVDTQHTDVTTPASSKPAPAPAHLMDTLAPHIARAIAAGKAVKRPRMAVMPYYEGGGTPYKSEMPFQWNGDTSPASDNNAAAAQGVYGVTAVPIKDNHRATQEQKEGGIVVTSPIAHESNNPDYTLGSLSEHEESGGKGPGTVSRGMLGEKEDAGGVSYGTYQLTSKTKKKNKYIIGGSVKAFINSRAGEKWRADFVGLTPGTKEFTEVWKKIAGEDPELFRIAQHDFIKENYYDVSKAKLRKTLGLDIDKRSGVLRDVVWSTAVQNGGENNVIKNALKNKNINQLSDEEIIKLIYAERAAKKDNAMKYFSYADTKGTQQPLIDRFKREQNEALKRLKQK